MATGDHHDLVTSAASGDEAAVAALLVRHLPQLTAFLRLNAGPDLRARESASDLAQSVCREVLAALEQFDYRGEAAFRAWLFVKAKQKLRDRVRHGRAQRRDVRREVDLAALAPIYGTLTSPSQAVANREQQEQLEAVFAILPERYREVLTLAHFAGLSRAEIGAAMGLSEGAVRSLLHRAHARLSWELS